MRLVTRNDDPPSGDTATEALFDAIYEQLEQYPDVIEWDDFTEKLAVWIADMVQASYADGYAQGQADAKEALDVES